jgi:two-component system response regulator YesN
LTFVDEPIDPENIGVVFYRYLTVIKDKIYRSSGSIISGDPAKIPSYSEDLNRLPPAAELLHALEIGNRERTFKWVDKCIEVIMDVRLHPDLLINFLNKITYDVNRLLSDLAELVTSDVSISAFFPSKPEELDIEALELNIRSFAETTLRMLGERRSDSSESLITAIQNEIKTRYQEELQINTIAQEFSMNPTYLGQLYKQQTGSYFNDYLNSVRIAKARELLTNTKDNLNSVAERTGYRSYNYFVKQFKKITGYSPGEYRKTHPG